MVFHQDQYFRDMIGSFGKFRFRRPGPREGDGMQLLLDECAETLGIPRFYAYDPQGEGVFLKEVKDYNR